MSICLLVLVGLGITNLIVNASILESIRTWIQSRSSLMGELVSCMLCSGFWVGFVLGLVNGVPPIYLGALVGLAGFLFSRGLDYLDLSIAIKANELEGETDDEGK